MKHVVAIGVFFSSWAVFSVALFVLFAAIGCFVSWEMKWFNIEAWDAPFRGLLAVISMFLWFPSFLAASFSICPYKTGGIVRSGNGR